MREYPLFDGHCDTAKEIFNQGKLLLENDLHTDLQRASEFSPYCQVYAIFTPDNFEAGYRNIMDNLKAQLDANSDMIEHCRTSEDISRCAKSNKSAALISVEGGELLGCDIDKLIKAKEEGVSSVNITWNYENALSSSNAQATEKGLTEKGKDFVAKCFEIGVAVDVSHISDPGFWDICEISAAYNKPFYASHSNSRAICPHRRNLTDDQFKAIIASGGVAGINMYTPFVGEDADIHTVISHIDHFLELGGSKNISMGADFDGCDKLPRGINGISDMKKLYDEMVRLGYGEELISDIFYNNMFRFFSAVI